MISRILVWAWGIAAWFYAATGLVLTASILLEPVSLYSLSWPQYFLGSIVGYMLPWLMITFPILCIAWGNLDARNETVKRHRRSAYYNGRDQLDLADHDTK